MIETVPALTEHAPEVIKALAWAIGIIIGVGGGAILILAKLVGGNWVEQIKLIIARLGGIESELKETNKTLANIKEELRLDIVRLERRHDDRFVVLDRRVSKMEAICDVMHGERKP